MGAERRRSPRIVIEPIRARVTGLKTEVTIDEVSFGGFRVKSGVPLELNAEYEFLVLPRAGNVVRRVAATAVRCRTISTDPATLFEIGFEFTDAFRSAAGIEALIGSVRSAQGVSQRQEVRVRVVPGGGR
jgi:hypothetical protein